MLSLEWIALKNNIFVNTIFCGNQQEGVNSFWKDGADYGKGKFFNIDANRAVQYVVTPYDIQITKCNERMNGTYISFGAFGKLKKDNQVLQDVNASSVSAANYAERVVSKSSAGYKNANWDLVDKVKEDKKAISKISKDDMPAELKGKTTKEVEKIIEEKTKDREKIQKEISELAKKRQQFIEAEANKNKVEDDLGDAIKSSILLLAKSKGYSAYK